MTIDLTQLRQAVIDHNELGTFRDELPISAKEVIALIDAAEALASIQDRDCECWNDEQKLAVMRSLDRIGLLEDFMRRHLPPEE